MSATPLRVPDRPTPEQSRLKVRIVPYSPPRLSFDGSLPSLFWPHSGPQDSTLHSHLPSSTSPSEAKSIDSAKGKALQLQLQPPAQTHEPTNDVLGHSPTSLEYDADRLTPSFPCPPASRWSPKAESHLPRQLNSARPPRSRLASLHSDEKLPSLPASYSATGESTVASSCRNPSASVCLVDDQCRSPLTPLDEELPSHALAPTPTSYSASPSSWNHRFVNGLRKRHRRTYRAAHAASGLATSSGSSQPSFNRLRKLPPAPPPSASPLSAKTSLRSARSRSTVSARSNYKTYANSSPVPGSPANPTASSGASFDADFEGASINSSQANVVVLGENSSLQSFDDDHTFMGQANYHILGQSHPRRLSKDRFSRESLRVPPLQPSPRCSSEQLVVAKSRSRGMFQARSSSSVSSHSVEEAFAYPLARPDSRHRGCESSDAFSCRPASSGSTSARWVFFRRPQWNKALLNVATDSHVVSKGPSQASLSSASGLGGCRSVGENPASPSPTHRAIASRELHRGIVRLIHNQDEHGDGLADLEALHHHPSRPRMHSLSSSYPSDQNLRSCHSSRSSSFSRSSVPAWARVYYGSGERRWLTAKPSNETMSSDFTGGTHGNTSPSRTLSADLIHTTIESLRRRPREPATTARRSDVASDLDHADTAPNSIASLAHRLRTQTSSIWSPHLRRDRRASAYEIWETPSTVCLPGRAWFGRQNAQPILFMAGFVFPPSWAFASFLSLPPIQGPEMAQAHPSTSHIDLQLETNASRDMVDLRLYYHARWWRTLNRAMAIVGVFVIGAIVALVVFGVRQRSNS